VSVEKLFFLKSAKNRLRQDGIRATFSTRVDIFYPQILGCFSRKESFSTDTGDYTTYAPIRLTPWSISEMIP
jgi:hypothetical protein